MPECAMALDYCRRRRQAGTNVLAAVPAAPMLTSIAVFLQRDYSAWHVQDGITVQAKHGIIARFALRPLVGLHQLPLPPPSLLAKLPLLGFLLILALMWLLRLLYLLPRLLRLAGLACHCSRREEAEAPPPGGRRLHRLQATLPPRTQA